MLQIRKRIHYARIQHPKTPAGEVTEIRVLIPQAVADQFDLQTAMGHGPAAVLGWVGRVAEIQGLDI